MASRSPSSPPPTHEQMLQDAAMILPAERGLIGAMMGLWERLSLPSLLPTEFLHRPHQLIWAVMHSLDRRREPPAMLAVKTALAERGELTEAGGPAYLALCFEEGHIPAYVPGLARQVRDAARERAKRAMALELLEQGMTDDEIQTRLRDLPGPLGSALFDPAYNWARIVDEWVSKPAILTGLDRLDNFTGGMRRGQVVVVAGRTAHGKTSWTCDRAKALASHGVRVELLTLEDSQDDIMKKLIANDTGLDLRRVASGDLSSEEFAACEDAVRRLQAMPLKITDLGTLDESAVDAVVSGSDAELVMVDHIQKIRIREHRGETYAYALKRLMDRFHEIAKRDGKVLWINAQVGREMETQKRAPGLADLRDSGGLEEGARQVWLLYWPAKHDPDKRSASEYEVHVGKNTGGQTGKVDLTWDPRTGRFSDTRW